MRQPINFLTWPNMRSPLLPSEVSLRTWACLLKIASPQWTAGIVTYCCNCLQLPSSDWWMTLAPPLQRETTILTLLPVLYPISLSTFCPTTSASWLHLQHRGDWEYRAPAQGLVRCVPPPTWTEELHWHIWWRRRITAFLERTPQHVPVVGEVSRQSGDHIPRTSTVESDFLVVKYEKNRNRMCLSDAIIKSILHSKQYRRMRSLGVWFLSEYFLNKQFRIAPKLTYDLAPNLVHFGIVQQMSDKKWSVDVGS